jgi:hypothetical protein
MIATYHDDETVKVEMKQGLLLWQRLPMFFQGVDEGLP